MSKLTRLIILTALLFTSIFYTYAQVENFTTQTNAFLKQYVSQGFVNYKAIKQQPAQLEALTNLISTIKFKNLQGNEQKAALINAYNVLVIKGVVNAYPINSPLEVKGFFKEQKYNVGGELMTLDYLEKEFLFKNHPDAKLHFALVCAATGCPKLSSMVYQANMLDKQLEMQTRKTLNNGNFIRQTGDTVFLSEIFKWYRQHFEADSKDVISFINKYRSRNIDANSKVDYYTYVWELNEPRRLSNSK